MWANAQPGGHPAEYRWRPLMNAAKFGWRPLLECRAVMLKIQQNARLGCKVNFARGKIRLGDKSTRKSICSVPAQETVKHRAKFGWPPLSDVSAVTKTRPETNWNLSECPKLVNRSQPLVGWRSTYCENMTIMEEISLFNKFFSDCLYVP